MPQGNYLISPCSWPGVRDISLMYEDARMYDDGDFITVLNSSDERFSTFVDMDMVSSQNIPTAVGKSLTFNDSAEDDWKYKSVKQWTELDVMNWIGVVAEDENSLEYLDLIRFRMDGMALWNLTKREFSSLNPVIGPMLFNALEKLKLNGERLGHDEVSDVTFINLPPFTDIKREDPLCYTTLDSAPPAAIHHTSDNDSDTDRSMKEPVEEKPKRRPGRPPGGRGKRKPEKKCGRLWEFIRDLLLNKNYCPSLICWENYDEGVFRFVRSDKVAELWGTIKENPKMTYEKLSRAMRYYYKSKVLQPVLGRRLVYKFGPTAKGWHTPDPNFRLASN